MKEKLLADIQVGPSGGFKIPGILGSPGSNAPTLFNQIITLSIGVMTVIAFIWFTFQFLIAAIGIIGSSGDKAKLAEAKGKMSTSIIGIVVVISAIFIIELVGSIFGISILRGALYAVDFTNP